MAESMVGLNRLPSKIEARKRMFLHKIISLPAGSVSRQLFNRKLILYLNNRTSVTLGFVCDICQILSKHNLQFIINNLMLPVPSVPTKREWKTIVNGILNQSETALWNHRLAIDSDFTFLPHTAPFYHTIGFVSSMQHIV